MTVTQTVEIPANRRLVIEVPQEVPEGKAKFEYRIIPFNQKVENPTKDGKLKFTRKELDEMVKNCPITQKLSGILSSAGDVDLDEIRMARLAKHLK